MSYAEGLLARLVEHLRPCGSLAVAFSGGVDSSALLAAAASALPGKVVALTVESTAHSSADRRAAGEVLGLLGVPQRVIEVDTLRLDAVRFNAPDRCYHCKLDLFSQMLQVAQASSLGTLVDGTNADDLKSHRPGLAALRELGVRSPLAELGLGKGDVRAIAKLLALPVAGRSSASCLLTRLPYGVLITEQTLARIDTAEEYLRNAGVRQVRVRDHGEVARIEVEPPDLEVLVTNRAQVVRVLGELGWRHVTLDLAGYRSGSFD